MIKTKLIGISGCTNGGKTTLSKKLSAHFKHNSIYLQQDDFYYPRNGKYLEFLDELDSFNFDVISAINMDMFHQELKRLIDLSQYEYILLDGFLLFEDRKLYHMLDKRYFLHLSKEECLRRRISRNYKTVDTPNYFDKCVWVEYLKYKQKCEMTYDQIVYLNGSNSPDEIFNFVLNDIANDS
jgi:nicotinamide/nicotinate riboside kinase